MLQRYLEDWLSASPWVPFLEGLPPRGQGWVQSPPSEQLQAITLLLPAFAEELRMAHHASELQPLTTRPRQDAQYDPGHWTTRGEVV